MEILQLEYIKLLVDSFYRKVREDALLAPIFNERISDHWPKQMEKMYGFWQTLLPDEHTYPGSTSAHLSNLPVDKIHFTQ